MHFRAMIETPADGAVVGRRAIPVRGWAFSEPHAISRIEISIDGRPYGRARAGCPRADVARLLGEAASASKHVAGFEEILDPDRAAPLGGEIVVSLRAVATDGSEFPVASIRLHVEDERPSGEELERARRLEERTLHLVAQRRRSTRGLTRRLRPSSGLRILVFAHDLSPGGAQRYLLDVLTELAPRLDGPPVVVSPRTGPLLAQLEALSIPVHVTSGYPVMSIEEYEGKQLELAAWAADQRFDLVFANTILSFPGVDLARRLGLPVVWRIVESLPVGAASLFYFGEMAPLVDARLRRALSEADALMFAAEATRSLFAEHVDAERVRTIPNALPHRRIAEHLEGREAFRRAVRERAGIPPEAFVLLNVGVIQPRKCQTILAQAFAAAARERPDLHCIFVGSLRDAYADGLARFLEAAGVADRTRIVDVVTDPEEWYCAADAVVQASDIESYPFMLLEALAFGLPVVATDVFGTREVVEDGVTGYLCEPRDVVSMLAALSRLLSTGPAERQALGEAGRERVASYGIDDYCSKLLELFRDVASRRGAFASPSNASVPR